MGTNLKTAIKSEDMRRMRANPQLNPRTRARQGPVQRREATITNRHATQTSGKERNMNPVIGTRRLT